MHFNNQEKTYVKSPGEKLERKVFFRAFFILKKLNAEKIRNFSETNENPIMLHIK